MKRLYIISNRLPVTVEKKGEEFSFIESAGGVATGIKSFYQDYDCIWIGWPGITSDQLSEQDCEHIKSTLMSEFSSVPVFINEEEYERFYLGFCNNVIWPAFHYFTEHLKFDESMWRSYQQVNEKFRDAALELVREGETVWVHDYQLMLLPRMLREQSPDLAIGFFLHIPFPSFEVFRLLQGRRQLLTGLLGSDLVGFHTYDYMRHFLSSAYRLLGADHELGRISWKNRIIKVDVFPMGIDYQRFAQAAQDPAVQQEIELFQGQAGGCRIILSIDRLDYTKGIVQRLQAYSEFLERCPEYREKVILIMVAVPTRTEVEQYQSLKEDLDQLVGQINGEHGTVGWIPVWYLYRSLPFESLVALYNLADVAMVTPLRDGMNLVAKEYVASKTDGHGVIILSEMAGAAKELSESLIINPYNREHIIAALETALTMGEEEQAARIRGMRQRLEQFDVIRWAREYIAKLGKACDGNKQRDTRLLTGKRRESVAKAYRAGRRRLVLLDYDGTLREFVAKPSQASPGKSILAILRQLKEDPGNQVAIISGRDRQTLDKWFQDLSLTLVAEHGAWIKKDRWRTIGHFDSEWKGEIAPILASYADHTPGSFIEEKEYSLVWHYRAADLELAEIRARELMDDLKDFTANRGLDVLKGNKVVEIKNMGIDKGHAAKKIMGNSAWDFMMAIGDDWTDEDTFEVLPESAYTIKVGRGHTNARYSLLDPADVLAFLGELAG